MNETNKARAKALMLRQLMRRASDEGVSCTAQALLATLIAESWPSGKWWYTKLGHPVLMARLGIARNTLRKAGAELEIAGLVKCKPGHGHRITTWALAELNDQPTVQTPRVGVPVDPQRVNLKPLRVSESAQGRVNLRPRVGVPVDPQRGLKLTPLQSTKIYSEAKC